MVVPGKVLPKLPGFMDLFKPDKLIHLFIFGVYVLLQIRGFVMQDTFPNIRKNAVPLTLIIGIMLGAGTELLQRYYIPLRRGSMYDFIADVVGCLLGWGVFVILEQRKLRSGR